MKELILLSAFAVLLLQGFGWGGGDECNQGSFPLIETSMNNAKIRLNKGALKLLRSPKYAERLIIPISVIGPTRSGKSFFLNSLTQCLNLFGVGHEEKAGTIGASAFLMDSGKPEDPVYLLIDTEGFGHVNSLHDRAILHFATWTSSHLIYHLDMHLVSSDIDNLHGITVLLEKLEAGRVSQTIKIPSMTWVADKYGYVQPINPDDILREISTAENVESQPLVDQHDRTVRRIKEYFPYDPFYIPAATDNHSEWKNLDSYTFDKLSGEYLKGIDEVRREVRKKAEAKRLTKNGKQMNCEEYAYLLECVRDMVNNPNIDLEKIKQIIVDFARVTGKKNYEHFMSRLPLPMNTAEWEDHEVEIRKEVFRKFNESCFEVNESFSIYQGGFEGLTDSINQLKRKFKRDNENESDKFCEAILDEFKTWLAGCRGSVGCVPPELKVAQEYERLIGPKKKEYRERMVRLVAREKERDYYVGFTVIIVSGLAVNICYFLFRGHLQDMKVFDVLMPVLSLVSILLIVAIFISLLTDKHEQLGQYICEPSVLLFTCVAAVIIIPAFISLGRDRVVIRVH